VSGPTPRQLPDQLAEFAKTAEVGPNHEVDGVVRWRRIDLKRVIRQTQRRVSWAARFKLRT
jgi:putative transposase